MQDTKKRLILTFLALCCIVGSPQIVAQSKTLNFAVNSPGSPPILYFDDRKNEYLGLLPDMLASPIARGELSIRYLDSNRTRSEQFLYEATSYFMNPKEHNVIIFMH